MSRAFICPPSCLIAAAQTHTKKIVPFIFFPCSLSKSFMFVSSDRTGWMFHRQPSLLPLLFGCMDKKTPQKRRGLKFSIGCAAKEELLVSTSVFLIYFLPPPPHPHTALLCSASPAALSSSSSLHRWKLRRHPSSLLIGVLPDMVRCNYWCLILSGNAVH